MSAKPVHVEVVARENEPFDKLLKRFLKKIKKIGLLDEMKKKNFYKKPSELRREKEKQRLHTIQQMQEENSK